MSIGVPTSTLHTPQSMEREMEIDMGMEMEIVPTVAEVETSEERDVLAEGAEVEPIEHSDMGAYGQPEEQGEGYNVALQQEMLEVLYAILEELRASRAGRTTAVLDHTSQSEQSVRGDGDVDMTEEVEKHVGKQ